MLFRTTSAVPLTTPQAAALIDSLNDYAYSLSQTGQKEVAKARNYAQSFTSIFGQQVPPSYIDLAHFAALTAQATGDRDVQASANRLISALTGLRLHDYGCTLKAYRREVLDELRRHRLLCPEPVAGLDAGEIPAGDPWVRAAVDDASRLGDVVSTVGMVVMAEHVAATGEHFDDFIHLAQLHTKRLSVDDHGFILLVLPISRLRLSRRSR